MLSNYIRFIDRNSGPAFLWAPVRGIAHANVAAWAWTDDLVQHDVLESAANRAASTASAEIVEAAGARFLLLPLLGAAQNVEYVLGIVDVELAGVPRLLHELHENPRHFSQIVHLLPQVVLTARPDGQFDYASRRWYQVTGLSTMEADVREQVRTMLAREFHEFEHRWAAGISSGDEFAFELPMRTARHRRRWHELRAAPIYDEGRIRKWVVTLEDADERVRARGQLAESRRRSEALARIGALALDPALDDRSMIEQALAIAAKAMPAAWIASLQIDERDVRVSQPPDLPIDERTIGEAGQLDGVVSTRESWLGDEVRPVMRAPLSFGQPGFHRLIVGGTPGFAFFEDVHVAFLYDVAWRLETALRNRIAFRRETMIARTLQTAMLPVSLPRSASVRFDVSYQPAEVDTLIGGDWYDAFELRDGRLAFSIGDVAGHGLEAAVVMGHVREVLRAIALQGGSPSAALEETNGVVLAGGHGLITAVLGYIDPATLLLEYAAAGHAPPLYVMPNGDVRVLPLGDVILGAVPRAKYHTHAVRLEDEGALVLYTDGLTEYAHDAVAGETKLRDVLGTWAAGGFKESADQLAERALDGSACTDDAAMLIVRTTRRMARTVKGADTGRRASRPFHREARSG